MVLFRASAQRSVSRVVPALLPVRVLPCLFLRVCLVAALALPAVNCGGGVTGSPQPIVVILSPTSITIFLGATQQFTVTVSNTSNTAVTWSVNGIVGGDAQVGFITNTGLYTAPQNLPTGSVTVTATSQADSSKSASATVSVQSDLVVVVAPNAASVELGATRQFTENVTGSGNPSRAVSWSVNDIPGGNATFGTITAAGLYTAPQILPGAAIKVTATSVADPSKKFDVAVTITSNLTVAITSGPGAVNNGASAQYAATVTPAPNSNPNRSVNWSVSCGSADCGAIDGTGLYTAPVLAPSPPTVTIRATSVADPSKSAAVNVTINALIAVIVLPEAASVPLEGTQQFSATVGGVADQAVDWSVNGMVGGDATVGTITNTAANPGLYAAPVNMPSPNQVIIRATRRGGAESDTAVVTLFSNIAVAVAPETATRAVNRRLTLTAQVSNSSNTAVEWRVNGILGGSAALGRICLAGVEPCFGVTAGNTVDYLAPSSVPSPSQVSVEATSQADRSKKGTAAVNIVAQISVTVSPTTVSLPLGARQQFTATVLGTPDQRVSWSATCSSADCGTMDAAGLYTAPATAPSGAITVRATSVEDPSQSAAATVTISSGAFIQTLRPSSLAAGASGSFLLRLLGTNLETGSTIVFQGVDKTTSCTGSECTAALTAADLSTPGDKTIQLRSSAGTFSNQVLFVVLPAVTAEEVISLTGGNPTASDKTILVPEPTTAAEGTQVNVEGIGLGSQVSCSISGTSVAISRPASGTQEFFVCLSGTGLDPSHTYTLSGPTPNDLTIEGAEALGSFIRLRLVVSSATTLGLRTIFVETAGRDKAAASGAIEVK